MGVSNLTHFIHCTRYTPNVKVSYFDSILIDIQSILYAKIDTSFKHKSNDIVDEACVEVVKEFTQILKTLLKNKKHKDEIKVIIGFDGEGVPMKWPLQRIRRSTRTLDESQKNILKDSLFENNYISRQVYKRLKHAIQYRKIPIPDAPTMLFYLSSSKLPGEGEHKIFHLAQKLQCKHPVVVSVDNDVFMIAMVREATFDSIQIVKSFRGAFYDLKIFKDQYLKCEPLVFVQACFLVGNDFIPEIIQLTKFNVLFLHAILKEYNDPNGTLPNLLKYVVHEMLTKKKIRFQETERVDPDLVKEFYKTCFWMMDYYQQWEFPQKYLKNKFYDMFDRNMILTALLHPNIQHYEAALRDYMQSTTKVPNVDAKTIVFPDAKRSQVERYLLKSNRNGFVVCFKI